MSLREVKPQAIPVPLCVVARSVSDVATPFRMTRRRGLLAVLNIGNLLAREIETMLQGYEE